MGMETSKRVGGWELDVILHLIRCFCASEGGKRSILNRSLVANMRKMEVSSLVVRETGMRPSYGRLLGNIGTPFIIDLPLW